MGRKWAWGLIGVALAATPAGAAGLAELVAPRDGAAACWSRHYDAAHLADHPHQKVEAMTFAISYMGETSEYAAQHNFHITVDLRDGTKGHNSGVCYESDGGVLCGIECDGGYVMVEPRDGGSVLLDLERSGYIYMSGGCGAGDEEEGFPLEAGRDDKSFLLHPLPAKSCKALVDR